MNSDMPDPAAVEAALADFKDPETGQSALRQGQIRDIRVSGQTLSLTLALSTHSAPLWEETREALAELLRTRYPRATVDVSHAVFDRPPMQLGPIGLTAKSVIVVGSGKGGVGKSTMAASVAIGLMRSGCRVGLLDADVYGPSIPHLLGLPIHRPAVDEATRKLQPVFMGEMPVMSMGFLVPPDEAVVWRGPMLHGAITQFLRDTAWGLLDYLIIDMPPGTGDVALTLSQAVPLTGAIVVCTPQDVALLDAVKAITMFRKVNIPVLGMIENMSGFICPECNKRYDIFGSGGARDRAAGLGLPVLGEVPIRIAIREYGDRGQTVANFDHPEVARDLEQICHRLSRNLADTASKKPAVPQLPVL